MKTQCRSARRGFSLIVTLVFLALISLLVMGMLGLSTSSRRTNASLVAQAEARANARMALTLALGELQKQLGPDQRISARADILDNKPATSEADDVAYPRYVGVWDSWNAWLTDKKGSLSIQDTYKRGRDTTLFRGWLVSNANSMDYGTALTVTPAGDMVKLCGEGSAGTDPANHVEVGRVKVPRGDRVTGKYAWWIADEAQKARLDLKTRDGALSASKAQAYATHTGRAGIETMDGMKDFDTSPGSLQKMVTIGQASLSAAATPRHFHDLTAYSKGLLTDVRSGGFKADLSLAFESDTIPGEMDQANLFGGRPFDAPIRPMTGELGKIVPQNPYVAPMSWRQLREYYRLYRPFSDSNAKKPLQWSGNEPYTRRYIMWDAPRNLDVGGYARQPVLLSMSWILATYCENTKDSPPAPGGVDYYLMAVPIFYWWNPYNVAMKVESNEIASTGSLVLSTVLWQTVYSSNGATTLVAFPDRTTTNAKIKSFNQTAANSGSATSGFNMIPVGAGGSGSIEFEPGEVRIFSTDISVNKATAADAKKAPPGYTPVQSGSVGLRGVAYRIDPGSGTNPGPPTLSLRVLNSGGSGQITPLGRFFGFAPAAGFMQPLNLDSSSPNRGIFTANGTAVTKNMETEPHDWVRYGVTSIDWVTQAEMNDSGNNGTWIIKNGAPERARWGTPGSSPMPVAIFGIVAKSAEQLAFASSAGFAKDYRNRGWLHAPPTRLTNLLINPKDLNRADSPYQVFFTPVNGDQEVSQYFQANGENGYFGGGYTAATGQTRLSMHSLPTAPVMNLASLAGVRIDHARARIQQKNDSYSNPTVDKSGLGSDAGQQNYKHLAHAGGAFGAGIGNDYAHPMIQPSGVYTGNNLGKDPGYNGILTTNLPVCDDYWDHLFLANEELWDSWFFSGLAPEVDRGAVTKVKSSVARDFFSGKPTLLPTHFQPDLRGKTPEDFATLVEITKEANGKNGWDRIGAHLLNNGQFNVNSTSKDAWKAMLMSLRDRPLAYNETGTPAVINPDPNTVSLSRHSLANSSGDATGPQDPHAWRGIRKLNEAQIDKLAEEIVRQVKLRGPFLNMAEFINRRLSNDDLGVVGALQAAIDWDEFNAGYDGTTSGSGESINKDYKGGGSMIRTSQLPVSYPNSKAATGSRYAGIPGYVMQSDLLQGLASSISVRGDTFLIRTYGEVLAADNKVVSRAWCEAVAQRNPEYIDPADDAATKLRQAGKLPEETAELTAINKAFGRRFSIISFRWLNENEI